MTWFAFECFVMLQSVSGPVVSLLAVSLLLVPAVAWIVFAFASEMTNPFRRPPQLLRPRWRYGRKLGGAALVAGIIAALVAQIVGVTVAGTLLLFALLFAPPACLFSLRHHGRSGV